MSFWDYAGSILTTAVAVALLVVLLIALKRRKKGTPSSKESVIAGLSWLTIFLFGLTIQLVYCFTNPPAAEAVNPLKIIGECFDRSISMFAFAFKQSNVVADAWQRGMPFRLYACVAFAVNVAAGVWTYYFLVHIFFRRIANGLKLFWRRIECFGTQYIIVGANEQVDLFLADLNRERGNLFRGDRITIITGTGDKGTAEKFKQYLYEGYAVISGAADENAFVKAGIDNKRRPVVVVAMTDSDETNLAVAAIVTKRIVDRMQALLPKDFPSLSGKAKEEAYASAAEKVKLDGRILYRFIERAEHFKFAEAACGRVNFFNPYELRARRFFYEHPITDYLGDAIDKKKGRLVGTYEGEKIRKEDGSEYVIRHLFLGFGDVNYQMLRHSILQDQLLGVDYHAKVFASDVDENRPIDFQARLMHQAPGLFGNLRLMPELSYPECPKEAYDIRFKKSDILSEQFYEELKGEIAGADRVFIYIGLGKDKLDIETALELRQMLATFGFDLGKIKIFAKVNARVPITSDPYLNGAGEIPLKIECYGFESEVYTKRDVVAMELDELSGILSNQHHGKSWGVISEFEKDSNRAKILHLPVALGLVGYRMAVGEVTDEEVMASFKEACGITANEDLIRRSREYASGRAKDPSFRLEYMPTANGEIPDDPRTNLARLEHLRWVAFHLLNGWTQKPCLFIGGKDGGDNVTHYFARKDELLRALETNGEAIAAKKLGKEDLEKIKLTKEDLENFGRKNALTKQHACITTLEGLVELRRHQAYANALTKANPFSEPEFETLRTQAKSAALTPQAEGQYDTLNYDFNVIDDLPDLLPLLGNKYVILKKE